MFENLSHLALQHYWWFIVSLLGSMLVFLLFVQGGQTLIYTLGKTEKERTLIVNALGRKWEFTFTTLVTFGGAFFASFPLFYSTSFGGAYWVWMAILFAFIVQAVSYEFRSKPNNFLGHKTFEVFLFLNGALGTILLGTAVATFFSGSDFTVNSFNQSYWNNSAYGLEAALSIFNVSLGLAVFFLARVLGLIYFMENVENEAVQLRAKKQLMLNAVLFVVFFLVFFIWLLLRDGFAVDPQSGEVALEPYKYLKNYMQMPLVLILALVGVLSVLGGIAKALFKNADKSLYLAGGGTVLTVLSLFFVAGYNNTAFYPAFPFDASIIADSALLKEFLQSSLTIQNSSSSHYTLTAMSYVSLMVPFVLLYIVYTWRAMNKKKISLDELSEEDHIY